MVKIELRTLLMSHCSLFPLRSSFERVQVVVVVPDRGRSSDERGLNRRTV